MESHNAVSVNPSDIESLDLSVNEDKVYAPLAQLSPWDENPRSVNEEDLRRLESQLSKLGQYKPLLVAVDTVVPDGTVIGGNMRIDVMNSLGWDDVWVSLISPDTKDGLLEYALSDNDRVGQYDEDEVAELIESSPGLDMTDYKVDFYDPGELSEQLVVSMDPDELVDRAKDATKSPGDDTAPDGERETGDGGEPLERSMENLGSDSGTSMVQLFMSKMAKQNFLDKCQTLKLEYDVPTTSDVVQEAARREVNDIRADADVDVEGGE